MDRPTEILSPKLDLALRRASAWHRDQVRKGSATPYIQHPVAVAMILDRLGFEDDVVVAGLLHDVVEDSGVGLSEIAAEFGPVVAAIVGDCSEVKRDERGEDRPWIDRKRDYLDALANAPLNSRAVALADKLHNLLSIRIDLLDGRPVWSNFHASRDDVLWYYRTAIDRFSAGDDRRLARLASECRRVLGELEDR